MLKRINYILNPTTDVAATVHFYGELLGLPLVAAERRTVHNSDVFRPDRACNHSLLEAPERLTVLFELSEGGRLGFVDFAGVANVPSNPLPRWIKHLAMHVSDYADLKNAEERLRSAGIDVLGPVNHKLLESIYFFDPINDIRLEFTTLIGSLDELDAALAHEALGIFESGGSPQNRAFH
jgi:catechol 2,3-dioxygenase-like lactoylglutathione lyase family enzyme